MMGPTYPSPPCGLFAIVRKQHKEEADVLGDFLNGGKVEIFCSIFGLIWLKNTTD